jgi:hypothetical protein
MTSTERESFLAGLHVGMLGIERPDGPPLTIPVWYDYEPGGQLWFLTDGASLKGRLVAKAKRFSLCAQTEAPPYAYVSVEGAADIDASDIETQLRPMSVRYLGEEMGNWYTDNMPHGSDPIRVSMTPERWFSVDYSKMDKGD